MARAQTEADLTACLNWHINQHADVVKTLIFSTRDECNRTETARDWTGHTAKVIVKDPVDNSVVFTLDSAAGDITLDAAGKIEITFHHDNTALLVKQQQKQGLHSLEDSDFPGYEWELWLADAGGLRDMPMQGLIFSDTNVGPA